MSDTSNEIIVENSKVSLPVPVINGCYLHSRFNPLKEAEEFVEENFKKTEGKTHIIVLGLGFGYHINELVNKISNGRDNYKAIVIEPNKALVDKFNDIFSFDDPKLEIINHDNIEDYYFDETVIEFFQSKPAVINHKPSFNLNKEFFTKFLSYKAPKEVGLYSGKLASEELSEYFQNQSGSLEDVIKEKRNSVKIEDKNDYLVQIIGELR